MTKTEELLVAILDGDMGPFARFLRTLSDEDLAKFKQGVELLTTAVAMEEMSSRREFQADEGHHTAMEIIGGRG
jgi:hypothetical protein